MWSDAEAFLDYLDVAATVESDSERHILQARISGILGAAFAESVIEPVPVLAAMARRLVAAECCAFLSGAVPETERWRPCFRSQFRAEDGAARSGLDVIEWGLKHLDRVRSTMVSHDEGIAKSWQMVLGIALTLLGIIAQLVIASAKSH